jgi:hypothetical protein
MAETISSLKIDLDMSDLDAALEKAARLKAELEAVKALSASLKASADRGGSAGPATINVTLQGASFTREQVREMIEQINNMKLDGIRIT